MRAAAGQVVLLTCPLDRIRRPQHAQGRVIVAERNERLRSLVSSAGGGAAAADPAGPGAPPLLIDVDAMTRDLPPGLDVAPMDFHYACMLGSAGAYNGTGPLAWSGSDGRPAPAYPRMRYEQLLVPPVGYCSDPVNFGAVQLLLGLLP